MDHVDFSSFIHNFFSYIFPSLDTYDRCDKPSLLVTSPGSPDCQIKGGSSGTVGGRYANRLTPGGPVPHHSNVGGRIQIKLGFEISTLNVIVTIICAADLTFRTNGASRSPYAKVSEGLKLVKIFIKTFFFKFLRFFYFLTVLTNQNVVRKQ